MTARLFNSPLECSFRMLLLLEAATPESADLQRLITYDYLLLHSGDVGDGPESLHPAVPFRGTEWLVKRDLVRAALQLGFSKQLLDKKLTGQGVCYSANELTKPFNQLLKSSYAAEVRSRANWVVARFGSLDDSELKAFMNANVESWGAEFYRLPALRGLQL